MDSQEKDLLEFDASQIKWTDKEIFSGFFTRPKQAFDYIIEHYYNKYVVLILVFYGIIKALEKDVVAPEQYWLSIVVNVVLGGLFGWLGMYVIGGVLLLISKIFKGQADISQIVRVSSYAFIPILLGSLYKVVIVFVFRISSTPTSIGDMFGTSIWPQVWMYSIVAITVISTIHTLVLLVIGLRSANKYSLLKSVITILIPLLILIGVVLYIRFKYFTPV